MKKVVRLTENDFQRIVENAVRRVLKEQYKTTIEECDGAGGGGATNAAGAMQGGGTNPDAGQYTVPFAPVQRRKGYKDFMQGALDRKGGKNKSISMNRK